MQNEAACHKTNKRLIYVNALKRAIRMESWKLETQIQLALDYIDIIIDEQPTVDAVEVVHGRWEEWWPGISLIMTGEEMLYRCSACDAKYAVIEGYNYCPNCGADMRDGGNKDV